jgi:siroheme synthase-like protein
MASLFPIFVKLEGRRAVVIGAGAIADQKLGGLLEAGARIHVSAPEASPSIRELAQQGRLQWSQRPFEAADLDGATIVISATSNAALNAEVFRQAEARGILCNAVDQPDHCHFYYPSVVQRGDLQIAISTAGKSPALAQRLRKEFEQAFGNDYESWLNWLGRVRGLFFQKNISRQTRVRTLHQMARNEVFERYVRARQRRAM